MQGFLDSEMFVHFYEDNYHNLKFAKFTTLEVQKSNEIRKKNYTLRTVKMFLIEIQSCLEAVNLRTQIECNFIEIGNCNNPTKVEEFVTPFARIGLNCNKSAKFSINYFINPHLKELIGESLADTMEKRFNELANGKMKDFVKMIPLTPRYDKYFKEIQTIPNYKVSIT